MPVRKITARAESFLPENLSSENEKKYWKYNPQSEYNNRLIYYQNHCQHANRRTRHIKNHPRFNSALILTFRFTRSPPTSNPIAYHCAGWYRCLQGRVYSVRSDLSISRSLVTNSIRIVGVSAIPRAYEEASRISRGSARRSVTSSGARANISSRRNSSRCTPCGVAWRAASGYREPSSTQEADSA